jgi:hypothetical protein
MLAWLISSGVHPRPRAILDIIKSGESFRYALTTKMPEQGTCEKCGYISSQKWCKACVLLDGLNRGLPRLGIGRTRGKLSSATGVQTDNSSNDKQTSIRNDKRILKPSLDFWSIMAVSCDGACIINIQPTYRGSCQSKLLHGRRISWKVWSII